MKNTTNEFVQRIKSQYVGEDCIQVMVSTRLNGKITILNSEGMVYHYVPNSTLFINKYTSDERRKQFPYHQIPNHIRRIGFEKITQVNQLLDFNRVYLEIANGIITEDFVVKDGDEALIARKFIIPNAETTKEMTRDMVLELFKTANGGVFSLCGSHYKEYTIPTEREILEWFNKEQTIARRKYEENNCDGLSESLTEYFYNSIDRFSIDDVPKGLQLCENTILVSIDKNEIKSVKAINVKFMGADRYKVESYDFPITIYSLDHMKQLETTNLIETPEPKILKYLNKTISKDEINKSKKLSLEKRKK